MNSNQLRQLFLHYFQQRQHQVVTSDSLIPAGDNTLLFTNAGMVPFKEVFLGKEKRHYTRATSSQRCVRAGGKHNDLENVGYTARHHTFFEMLGNFSFGDYFKKDAIHFAWDFLTQELDIPAERLWVTVFDQDQESADIWLNDIGVDPLRFSKIGEKDNFWSMGDTGPCGPCTEIFYDHGEDIAGGPPGSPDEEGDRYIEIWNLVFMQYDRDASGKLHDLPKQSVDTGMGLERLAAVMQGVHNNYETDLFMPLIRVAGQLLGCSDYRNQSLRVIADHIRSSSFLLADGVIPSNEGRGYVLRRIIRRAIRHGHQLGMQQTFFYQLVPVVIEIMGDAYPELKQKQALIEQSLKDEEQQFARTLLHGMKILEQAMNALRDKKTIDGETVFKLYDTYGFPVDLTADIARECDLQLDYQAFDKAMEQQRQRARGASQFDAKRVLPGLNALQSEFTGYQSLTETTDVLAVYREGQAVKQLTQGDEGVVVLATTPFYAEAGGQVGDLGILHMASGEFQVVDTQKQGEVLLHYGCMQRGELKPGMLVTAEVNADVRAKTMANHSATHLLHAAMKVILGDHIEQRGSHVNSERLRFDFAHKQALTHAQQTAVENWVNAQIRHNHEVQTTVTSQQQAIELGAIALFGEKYADEVRVLAMGDCSLELCGGTHITRTGDIGYFKISSEASVASGIRRIEALTGQMAVEQAQINEQLLNQVQEQLKMPKEKISQKLVQLFEKMKSHEQTIADLQSKAAGDIAQALIAKADVVDGVYFITEALSHVDAKALKALVDQLKNQLEQAVIVLASVADGRVSLVAGVSRALTQEYHAGNIIKQVAEKVGGKGGGRADFAQAGGNQPDNLRVALQPVWMPGKN